MGMESPMRREEESENGKITNKDSLKDLMGKEAANDSSEPEPEIKSIFEAFGKDDFFEEGPRINPITKQPYTEEELEKAKSSAQHHIKKKSEYTDEELDQEDIFLGMTRREYFKKKKHEKEKHEKEK